MSCFTVSLSLRRRKFDATPQSPTFRRIEMNGCAVPVRYALDDCEDQSATANLRTFATIQSVEDASASFWRDAGTGVRQNRTTALDMRHHFNVDAALTRR